MKKTTTLTALILCAAVVFCGCSSIKTKEAIVNVDADITTNSHSAIHVPLSFVPDDAFKFSQSKSDFDSFSSYLHEKGTSSVNSRALIYRYDDYLIFSIAYFNCGTGGMETYFLSETQGKAFLDLARNYQRKTNQQHNESQYYVVGSEEYYFQLTLNGETFDIEPLPLDQLGLSLQDKNNLVSDDVIPSNASSEDRNAFVKSSNSVHHTNSLFNCIGAQVFALCGERILSFVSINVGQEDSDMEILLSNKDIHTIRVTNNGCVITLN